MTSPLLEAADVKGRISGCPGGRAAYSNAPSSVAGPGTTQWSPDHLASLVARGALSACGPGDADITRHFILSYGIDDKFQRATIVALVEEDGFIDRQILLFDTCIIDDQGDVVALPGNVCAPKFDHETADLLRHILGIYCEFDVVALAESAELFHIFVVARDQRAQLAARHFQVILRACEFC